MGDGAAEDFAGKLEAGAAGEGLQANFAVAELPMAAALLFCDGRGRRVLARMVSRYGTFGDLRVTSA